MTELSGLKILVTGAAKGIGRAIAEELTDQGALVAAVDIEAVSLDVAATGHCDVTDEASVQATVGWAADSLGGLDGLVNNAGIVLEKPLLQTTGDDFDRIIAVNLRGVFLMGREAVRQFSTRPSAAPPARIVNIASELAHLGRAEYAPYCASKGGVISLTRSWARELAPRVLINAVAPGPIDTDMLKSERQYAELAATAEGIALGRLGRPRDIAGVVSFLFSPASNFMTGSVVDVNGGAAMY